MQDILVYERFNEMRMCISFELYFFFLFGVKCIELWWYDSAQPSR